VLRSRTHARLGWAAGGDGTRGRFFRAGTFCCLENAPGRREGYCGGGETWDMILSFSFFLAVAAAVDRLVVLSLSGGNIEKRYVASCCCCDNIVRSLYRFPLSRLYRYSPTVYILTIDVNNNIISSIRETQMQPHTQTRARTHRHVVSRHMGQAVWCLAVRRRRRLTRSSTSSAADCSQRQLSLAKRPTARPSAGGDESSLGGEGRGERGIARAHYHQYHRRPTVVHTASPRVHTHERTRAPNVTHYYCTWVPTVAVTREPIVVDRIFGFRRLPTADGRPTTVVAYSCVHRTRRPYNRYRSPGIARVHPLEFDFNPISRPP